MWEKMLGKLPFVVSLGTNIHHSTIPVMPAFPLEGLREGYTRAKVYVLFSATAIHPLSISSDDKIEQTIAL